MSAQPQRFSTSKVLHYAGVLVILVGGLLYWSLKSPSVNPMADPQAAEAMAIVQTHRAIGAPTIRQSLDEHVKRLSEQGQGVRVGEWKVDQEQPGIYLVHISIREQGAVEWFERNYVWRVDVARRRFMPLSMPASGITPVQGDGERPSPETGPPMSRVF